jgi:hypothetical protein
MILEDLVFRNQIFVLEQEDGDQDGLREALSGNPTHF